MFELITKIHQFNVLLVKKAINMSKCILREPKRVQRGPTGHKRVLKRPKSVKISRKESNYCRHFLSLFDTFCFGTFITHSGSLGIHFDTLWIHFGIFGYIVSLFLYTLVLLVYILVFGYILAILDTFWHFWIHFCIIRYISEFRNFGYILVLLNTFRNFGYILILLDTF